MIRVGSIVKVTAARWSESKGRVTEVGVNREVRNDLSYAVYEEIIKYGFCIYVKWLNSYGNHCSYPINKLTEIGDND